MAVVTEIKGHTVKRDGCYGGSDETMIREILLLGNPSLYEPSDEVRREELTHLTSVIEDLHDTLIDFRQKHNRGRAIAAPQIGIPKRLIYLFTITPTVFINPVLHFPDGELIELWDDCMSFPDLFVRVRRHKRIEITYKDIMWNEIHAELHDDMSELLQHECDHLDGILAVSRAIDGKSFCLASQRHFYTTPVTP